MERGPTEAIIGAGCAMAWSCGVQNSYCASVGCLEGDGQDIWDNRILPGNMKDVRILCWDEEAELKEQILLWLMFEDADLV